jgi:hypothetical protein
MNYAGALLLILVGISLYSWNPDSPTVGTLALPLIIAGLLWGGLALNEPLRGRRHHRRSRNGSLRVAPALSAGYRRHRGSLHAPARRFAAENLLRTYGAEGKRGSVAMNALATVASGSVLKGSLRIAAKEAKKNLHGARVSMWAVLSAIVLTLTSSNLLLTGRESSLWAQSEILYFVTSLAVGLGLFVTGLLAADSMVGEKRATPEGILLTPTERGALLLGKVLGVMPAWLLIFAISVPYILVVGFGTSVSCVALIYTFTLGTLCVAGFATLTAGLGGLSRSGRGVTPVFLAIFVAMTAPTLLGATLQKSWFGDTYNTLSPVAQAQLSLESVIVDKEGLLMQLPHIGALMVFAVITGGFAAFAARRVSPGGGEWHERRGDLKPRDPHETTVPAEGNGSRLAGPGPEESVRL